MYSLRSRNVVRQQKLDFPVRKRKQEIKDVEENVSPSKKSPDRSFPNTEVLVVKRKQHIKAIQENVSPSKKDKSSGCSEKPPTVCRKLYRQKEPLHDRNTSNNENYLLTAHTSKESLKTGPPGTGKSATVDHFLYHEKDLLKDTKVVSLNCMRTHTPHSIFNKIATQLEVHEKPVETGLANFITTTDSMILIVLDEVDQLNSRGQHILYTLFEWPTLVNSHLILIGIANSLDLTDRVLPRLKVQLDAYPQSLVFAPYEKDQIVDILQNKLQHAASVLDRAAIEFCSRKVASKDGDIRKALEICYKALQAQTESTNVSIAHLSHVFQEVYGINVKDIIDTIPLHQKLAICSILFMVQGKSSKEVSLGKLYKTYEKVCQQQHLRYEPQNEFVSLLEMLDMRGIVKIKRSKEILSYKVCLQQESELVHILHDHDLISSVLRKGL